MITFGKYLTKYHSVKGNLYAFLGLIVAVTIHWGPIGVGLYLIVGEGRILAGILFPILWWISLALYFALLPLWWIIGIFKYGFIESTLSALVVLCVFSLPDILFWLAGRQKIREAQAQQFQWGERHLAVLDWPNETAIASGAAENASQRVGR